MRCNTKKSATGEPPVATVLMATLVAACCFARPGGLVAQEVKDPSIEELIELVEPGTGKPDATPENAEPAAQPLSDETTTPGDETAAGTEPEQRDLLPWLSDLAEVDRRALAEGKPVLVRAGAVWCPNCRKLEKEIAKPEVQRALFAWTRVYVDVDQAADEAAQLGVTAVPALFIRTAAGELVASHEGFLSGEDLTAWLEKHHGAALAVPDQVLLATGEPSALAVVQLTRQFDNRSAAVREAAIRRLLPYPNASGRAVLRSLREGRLSEQLASTELLREWEAPVEAIDPWRPETLTPERLAAIETWLEKLDEAAEAPAQPPGDEPEELEAEDLSAARAEMARMLEGTDREAAASRERLARFGQALLPEVYRHLAEATADQDRERLLALRYALAGGHALSLRWPGGVERLAATDSRVRQQAAEELVKRATVEDLDLLLELFSDPDPLVREISLRGLQRTGGKRATAELVKLLSDPEPNVRAAVLNELAESGSPRMVDKVAEYVKTETDADLLVHAIRYLRTAMRAAKGEEAARALIGLLKHESWQVRAEAAAGLAGIGSAMPSHFSSFVPSGAAENEQTKLAVDVCVAVIELLDDDDAFVVSRAVQVLQHADMVVAVDPLIAAAKKHPSLAKQIILILAGGERMRAKSLPQLREFTEHDDPMIRAAAIVGLVDAAAEGMDEELMAGLGDPESEVRVASAEALFQFFEEQREAKAQSLRQRGRITPSPFIVPGDTVVPAIEQPSLLRRAVKLLGEAMRQAKDDGPTEDAEETEETPEPEPANAPGFGTEVPEIEPPALEPPAIEVPKEGAPRFEPAEPADGPALRPVPVEPLLPADGPVVLPPAVAPGPVFDGPAAPAISAEPAEQGEKEDFGSAWDEWLAGFYAGDGRPEWTEQTVEPLLAMLKAEDPEEQAVAARALLPLGRIDEAIPVLLRLAEARPELIEHASTVLPWLRWEKRLEVFNRVRAMSDKPEHLARLIYAMVEVRDRRAADVFWGLLAEGKTALETAGAVKNGLQRAYLGDRHYSSSDRVQPEKLELARDARPRALAGSEVQRLVALSLLGDTVPAQAAEVARKLVDDESQPEAFRRDAFQVLLRSLEKREGIDRAIAELQGDRPEWRKLALAYLVEGPAGVRPLRGSIYMNYSSAEFHLDNDSSGAPIIPEAPAGLKPEHVRPFLNDSDPKTAAYAGYFLALLGGPEGMEKLLRYWRSLETDYEVYRLVYRAIAVLDDPQYIPILREIYGNFEPDDYNLRAFYWTIRIMSGPEILELRKQIRDEVGMSNLR